MSRDPLVDRGARRLDCALTCPSPDPGKPGATVRLQTAGYERASPSKSRPSNTNACGCSTWRSPGPPTCSCCRSSLPSRAGSLQSLWQATCPRASLRRRSRARAGRATRPTTSRRAPVRRPPGDAPAPRTPRLPARREVAAPPAAAPPAPPRAARRRPVAPARGVARGARRAPRAGLARRADLRAELPGTPRGARLERRPTSPPGGRRRGRARRDRGGRAPASLAARPASRAHALALGTAVHFVLERVGLDDDAALDGLAAQARRPGGPARRAARVAALARACWRAAPLRAAARSAHHRELSVCACHGAG